MDAPYGQLPGEERLVHRVVELRSRGATLESIVEIMAAEGFAGRTGGPLRLGAVARVVRRFVTDGHPLPALPPVPHVGSSWNPAQWEAVQAEEGRRRWLAEQVAVLERQSAQIDRAIRQAEERTRSERAARLAAELDAVAARLAATVYVPTQELDRLAAWLTAVASDARDPAALIRIGRVDAMVAQARLWPRPPPPPPDPPPVPPEPASPSFDEIQAQLAALPELARALNTALRDVGRAMRGAVHIPGADEPARVGTAPPATSLLGVFAQALREEAESADPVRRERAAQLVAKASGLFRDFRAWWPAIAPAPSASTETPQMPASGGGWGI